ncbi:MAG: FtsX-like permease family protein [Eubacterium sp.]
MTRALRKDFYVQIKRTFNRFITIFLIVALGVAFYAGIRSAEPDMRLSAGEMYKKGKLFDIRIVSTLGLTDDDVEAILGIEGVYYAEGTYNKDVMAKCGDSEAVAKVMTYSDRVNIPILSEGTIPKEINECIIDRQYYDTYGYNIGDIIELESEDFNVTKFKITGVFDSSEYLTRDKGTTTIGNGKINGLIIVTKEAFNLECYTDIYIRIDDSDSYVSYSDEYEEAVEEVTDSIEDDIKTICEEARYNQVVSDAQAEIESAKAYIENAKEKIDNAKADIEKAQNSIDDIKMAEWYILSREASVQSYVEFDQDAERIGNIGKVFPMIFFLVAAMVSLTTMTRMVNAERTQIGTLKALGYGTLQIAGKYLAYGFLATISGGIVGGYAGSKILPYIIIKAYKMMYQNLNTIVTPINKEYFIFAILLALISVTGATFFACARALMEQAASLMRPVSPRSGKKVFLENIPWIWNHLNFSLKSTFRNLFRYKKRLFMTLFGISGCMALMVVGFGLKYSVNSIISKQFGKVDKYDSVLTYKENISDNEILSIHNYMDNDSRILDYTDIYVSTMSAEGNDKEISIYLYVPENKNEFYDYIDMHNSKTNESYKLDDDSVVISEKLALLLDINVGDNICIKVSNTETYNIPVSAIAENYIYHYVYMSKELYEKTFGSEAIPNEALLICGDEYKLSGSSLAQDLLKIEGVGGLSFTQTINDKFTEMLGSMDIIILVLVVSAGALAFVVLYNLNNINIEERKRELATLKVLGFKDIEVSMYVYRENIIITFIGIAIGLFLGKWLHHYVILTAEIDLLMFTRSINFSSYVYSIILTIVFAIFINYTMHFKLKKVDMATSLKSVE